MRIARPRRYPGSVRLESRLAVSGLTPFAGSGAMDQVIQRVEPTAMFLKSLRSSGSGDREPQFRDASLADRTQPVARHRRFVIKEPDRAVRAAPIIGRRHRWKDDRSVAHMSAEPERPTMLGLSRADAAGPRASEAWRPRRDDRALRPRHRRARAARLDGLCRLRSRSTGGVVLRFRKSGARVARNSAPLLMRYPQLIEFRSGEGFTLHGPWPQASWWSPDCRHVSGRPRRVVS